MVERVQGFGGGAQWKRFVDGCCAPLIATFAELIAPVQNPVPPPPGDARMRLTLPADAINQFSLGVQKMDDPDTTDATVTIVVVPAVPPGGPLPVVGATVLTPGATGQYGTLIVDVNTAGGNVGDLFDLILTNACGCCANVSIEITPAIP